MNEKINKAVLNLELSDEMAKYIQDEFSLEIEFLNGSSEKMTDGRTRYKIEVTDPNKIELLKGFVLQMISKSRNINYN